MAATSVLAWLWQCWDCGVHSSSPPPPSWHRHSCAASQLSLPFLSKQVFWGPYFKSVGTTTPNSPNSLLKSASVPQSLAGPHPLLLHFCCSPSRAHCIVPQEHHLPAMAAQETERPPSLPAAHTWRCVARWQRGQPELPQAKNSTELNDKHLAIGFQWKCTTSAVKPLTQFIVSHTRSSQGEDVKYLNTC